MSDQDLSHIEPDLRNLATPIGDLRPDPRQAKTHGPRSVGAVKASLAEHGQMKPIVVDSSGTIRAGHGTVEAARELGWTHVAAVRSDASDEDLRAFALRDNRTAELSGWNIETLMAELDAVNVQDAWDEKEIEELAAAINPSVVAGRSKNEEIKKKAVVSLILTTEQSEAMEHAVIDWQISNGGTRSEAMAAICRSRSEETG